MIWVIDSLWKDHLYAMDSLREGIGLRAYGQKDPLIEYKREGFEMFESLLIRIREEILEYLFKVQPLKQEEETYQISEPERIVEEKIPVGVTSKGQSKPKKIKSTKKIGRNQPCICGSGKKYKYCCGR
jgi:preprotein translocase subunit SecA